MARHSAKRPELLVAVATLTKDAPAPSHPPPPSPSPSLLHLPPASSSPNVKRQTCAAEAGAGGEDCAGLRAEDGYVLAVAREGSILLPVAGAVGPQEASGLFRRFRWFDGFDGFD